MAQISRSPVPAEPGPPGGGAGSDSVERRAGDRYVVWTIAAVAGAVAALSSAAPTGLRPADALWCAALAALVTVAASRARRWPTLWFAGVVSAGSIGSWWVVAALVALALAFSTAYSPYRNRLIGALVGALGVQAMLRMPAQGFHGLPSLIALVAMVPLLASAYERSSGRVRRRARRTAYAVVAAAMVATALFGVAAFLSRSNLTDAVRESKSGLELIRDGKQDKATGPLATAAEAFQRADSMLRWAVGLAGPGRSRGGPAPRGARGGVELGPRPGRQWGIGGRHRALPAAEGLERRGRRRARGHHAASGGRGRCRPAAGP